MPGKPKVCIVQYRDSGLHQPHHPNTILINLDTAPLATMSTMHLHEGKQNNANVQSSKKRRTAKENSNRRGGSNIRFDEASTHSRKSLITPNNEQRRQIQSPDPNGSNLMQVFSLSLPNYAKYCRQ
jgi:hypothetical protein